MLVIFTNNTTTAATTTTTQKNKVKPWVAWTAFCAS